MHISKLPNVFKVADVEQHPEWNKMVKFVFCVDKEIQKSTTARIYVLVVDREIIKIGGSADKGGILGTLNWYEGGFSGNPDDKGRTLGVPTALLAAIKLGRKVEVYMTFAPTFKVEVLGITENAEMEVSGYKQMETLWVNQFMSLNGGKAPILNMQESGERHPDEMLAAIQYYYSLVNAGATISGKGKRGKTKRPFTNEEKMELQRYINEAVDSYKSLFDNAENIDNMIEF